MIELFNLIFMESPIGLSLILVMGIGAIMFCIMGVE